MVQWIKVNLAKAGVIWHGCFMKSYEKYLNAGGNEDYCFRGITKHFMKLLEAYMYLTSVGAKTLTPEISAGLERLNNTLNKS